MRSMLGRKERPDPQKSLVGFIVGDIAYAVPIRAVREIINPAQVSQIPHLPPAIAGVADHRGDVIPLVNLRARFGVPPAEDNRRAKWILVTIGDQSVGLIVDSVTEVFGTGGEELKPPPRVGGDEHSRAIVGVISHSKRLTFVLDVSRFEELIAQVDMSGFEKRVVAAP